MTDAEHWLAIRALVEAKREKYAKDAKDKLIFLEFTKACVEICHRHGERHMSEFNGQPASAIAQELERLRAELALWEACLALVEPHCQPDGTCVVVKATAR